MKLEPSGAPSTMAVFISTRSLKPELFVVSVSDQLSGIAPAVTVFDTRTPVRVVRRAFCNLQAEQEIAVGTKCPCSRKFVSQFVRSAKLVPVGSRNTGTRSGLLM